MNCFSTSQSQEFFCCLVLGIGLDTRLLGLSRASARRGAIARVTDINLHPELPYRTISNLRERGKRLRRFPLFGEVVLQFWTLMGQP